MRTKLFAEKQGSVARPTAIPAGLGKRAHEVRHVVTVMTGPSSPPSSLVHTRREGDEPRLLQDADVLLHAGEGHAKPVGQVRDRGVRPPELLEHAAPGGIRERGKRGIDAAGAHVEVSSVGGWRLTRIGPASDTDVC